MRVCISEGLYRLVKLEEDHNPVFPSEETVVEIRGEEIINLSTSRSCALSAIGPARALHGPIANPYDITPIENLPKVNLGLVAPATEAGQGVPTDD